MISVFIPAFRFATAGMTKKLLLGQPRRGDI